MKRIFVLTFICMFPTLAVAVKCGSETYTISYACYPGYYLSETRCIRCPQIGTDAKGVAVYGTTVDKNTGDITSCYAPADTYNDDIGTFIFTSDCSYVP